METKKIDQMIRTHNMYLIKNDTQIKVRGADRAQMDVIRNHKAEFIARLKEMKEEKAKANIDAYSHLEAQLPALPEWETDGDDVRAKELMERGNSIQYYSGTESDGLNLSVSRQKAEIMAEARQHCNHDISVSLNRTYTADARKLLERVVECRKCGKEHCDKVSDEVPQSAMWR